MPSACAKLRMMPGSTMRNTIIARPGRMPCHSRQQAARQLNGGGLCLTLRYRLRVNFSLVGRHHAMRNSAPCPLSPLQPGS